MADLVVNVKTYKGTYFLIDRRTRWGNPFRMHGEYTRAYVVRKFEEYAKAKVKLDPHWLDPIRLHVRRGIPLGCHCHPQLCHGDILVSMVEEGY